jgi:hypothetical protein
MSRARFDESIAEGERAQELDPLLPDAFFALWKDADPDIPILKQAKAEYATLQ